MSKKSKKHELLDGEFIGIISDIQIDKSQKRYCINVTVQIWDGAKFHTYVKSFKAIFGLGRKIFQNFCEDFELYNKNKLDLSKALGMICKAELNSYHHSIEITVADNDDIAEMDTYDIFYNVKIANDVSDIPQIIEEYYFFPYDEDDYESDTEYYGIVRSWNRFNNDTLCINIAVLNGCNVTPFGYFINNINTSGEYDLYDFIEVFEDDADKLDLDETLDKLCTVTLYTAMSGKTYIRSVKPFRCNNKYKEKQYHLWANSYTEYMSMSDIEQDSYDMYLNY